MPQARRGYFQGSHPATIILASFLVLTLPMCILGAAYPALVQRFYINVIHLWLLGVTHFVITLTIYFQSANLRYFNSTWKNRVIYFLIPLAIMVFFDLYAALDLSISWPVFNLLLMAGVRLAEQHHVCRQSFGVTQLFKRRSGQTYPSWMRSLENYYFTALTLMIWLTFLAGGFRPSRGLVLGAVILGSMFLGLFVSHFIVWRKTLDRGAAATLIYLVFQSASACLAMYELSLYVFFLTMHYVEYHVLMAPRCFDIPLDTTSSADRLFARLRRNPVLFYAIIIVVAGIANVMIISTMGTYVVKSWTSWPTPSRMMLALFNGLFVMHYFVDAFIWKFTNPYYRRSLLPLYFESNGPARAASVYAK